jgi:hypothetical protein
VALCPAVIASFGTDTWNQEYLCILDGINQITDARTSIDELYNQSNSFFGLVKTF